MLTRRQRCLALAAVAVCAALLVAHVRSQRITPVFPTIAAESSPLFPEGSGWYPGEPFARADPNLRAWGSWTGDDANTGTVTLGPFAAPRILRFGVGGYPTNAGNTLHVERTDTGQKLLINTGPIGERWQICDFLLPADWAGRPIRLLGVDNSKILGGWFALTEPIRGGRGDGNNALLETYALWSLNGLLLGLLYFAAARFLSSGSASRPASPPTLLGALPPHWIPLVAGALVAFGGYLVYWAYFAQPWVGWAVTGALFASALFILLRPRRSELAPHAASSSDLATAATLLFTVGAFHLAVLHLFPTQHDFYTLAANRYREALPGDNMLSHMYAERLFAGQPPKSSADEWQSSDRPPLQVGWQLLTWPVAKRLQLDRKTFSGTSAVWFQLLWVAGLYGFLRSFNVSARRTAAWIAVLSLSGFFLQNTIFTWPKLSAGAFALAAFALLFLNRRSPSDPLSHAQPSTLRAQLTWSAFLAALAWLSHGGVAFSFLPLLPWVAWRMFRTGLRPWLPAAVVFAAVVLPWVAYQKFYDPPGNLLLKWHFAGQTTQDPRGFVETLRDGYAKLGWRDAVAAKISNFHGQVYGDWAHLRDFSAARKAERLNQEFFHTGRALTWWPLLAAFAVALAGLSNRHATAPPRFTRDVLALAGWLLATIVIWCLLMFGAYTASIHQGSYALTLGLFAFFTLLLERSGSTWLLLVGALQTVTFATTWATPNAAIAGPPTALPLLLLTAAPLVFFVARSFTRDVGVPNQPNIPPSVAPSPALANPPSSVRTRFRVWWANPRVNLWVLAVFAFLLFLRKPHAVHTPQLWAEDGSVFLLQNDLHGAAALTLPYMGYLHTLPRLIAFVTSHLCDPLWWPHVYNVTALLIWLAVIVRLFSARFAHLPGRPWLALAMIAVPHTGEVFFNITNLQWLTAFVLIQQAIIAPPRNRPERVSDLLILIVVALTGPFGIAFLPLFALRWLLEARQSLVGGQWSLAITRSPAFLALVVVLLCAAVQAWFVLRTGPRFDFQSTPLQLWPNLIVLARRLLAWPLLGHELALNLSPTVLGIVGTLFFAGLIAWVLRPDPHRPLRAQILLAFALITLAGIYRTRPDTWAADNLDYADRYFYIPRVLLAWLLIWEFHAASRIVAGFARLLCVTTLLIHGDDYTLRAPKNYQWSAHVDAIRRGEPASIPTLPDGWTLEYPGRRKP